MQSEYNLIDSHACLWFIRKSLMQKKVLFLAAALLLLAGLMAIYTSVINVAPAPTEMWIEPTETNGIPSRIDVLKVKSGETDDGPAYTYQIYLPGNADLEKCFLSWDGGARAAVDGRSYRSGRCPIPPADMQKTFSFKSGFKSLSSYDVIMYKGSSDVPPVFIDIDESDGNNTIAQMNGDPEHETECTGRININGDWYDMPKIKGRGNVTWQGAKDKKPYNVTLDKKINFPGIDSDKTKKWSLLAEMADHSLLCNRTGYHLADELVAVLEHTECQVQHVRAVRLPKQA